MTDQRPTVAIVGFLDTKAVEHAFVKNLLEVQSCKVVVVDVSISTGYAHTDLATHGPEAVCAASGDEVNAENLKNIPRADALRILTAGATRLLQRLESQGTLHGVLGMGGSNSSTLACEVMRALPLGLPKICVSTMASGDVGAYVGDSDICMMPSIVDISGTLNAISERVLRNAAAALAGMAHAFASSRPSQAASESKPSEKKRIALTMFGVTTPGVNLACEKLAKLKDPATGEALYEPVVFHCTGSGGRSMERFITEKWFDAVLDLTTTELADEHCGGVLSAGPVRLTSAGKVGIPQVVSLGALDMCNFGPRATVPEKYKSRRLHEHNSSITLMRTTAEECSEIGKTMAARLAAATGPVTVVVPKSGWSALDVDGGPFWDPEADTALVKALKHGLKGTKVELVEVDGAVNEEPCVATMVSKLHVLLSK